MLSADKRIRPQLHRSRARTESQQQQDSTKACSVVLGLLRWRLFMSTAVPSRLSVRFGDDLLQEGFTAIPNLVLNYYRELDIVLQEMMFIIHIWQYWWSEKDPYPSLAVIAERM